MELLFESRLDLRNFAGKLYFFQCKPDIHPEPVLEGDNAGDSAGASIYGSVFRDGGRFRMWYQAWPREWDGGDVAFVGYAESDDGITWRKPSLGLVDCGGKDNNLCDLGFHAPAVFIDPDGDASHRYRATGCSARPYIGAHADVTERGYYTAHSADGLHWELDSSTPTWRSTDVITSVYHPGRRQGQVAMKFGPRLSGFRRRSIWTAALSDGVWTEPRAALIPDDYDDVSALARGFDSGDYYGMGMLPAGQGTVAFLWQFRHSLPRTAGNGGGVFGAVDISLAYQSGDGDRWVHMPGRPDFLTHGSTTWMQGGLYSASNVTEIGDEHRLYLTGATHSHGWYVDTDWKLIEARKQQLIREGIGRLGFAHWPKWRLFGFRGDPEGALDIDLGPVEQPSRLKLNYEADRGGAVRANLIRADGDVNTDVAGHTEADSVPLTGNHVDQIVAWKDGDVIPPSEGRPVTAHLSLDCASVYAYELVPAR